MKTTHSYLMPHTSNCIMGLAVHKLFRFLHGNGLARLKPVVDRCWHETDNRTAGQGDNIMFLLHNKSVYGAVQNVVI